MRAVSIARAGGVTVVIDLLYFLPMNLRTALTASMVYSRSLDSKHRLYQNWNGQHWHVKCELEPWLSGTSTVV
jgi:hypothetical protein